ncbi:MAG: antibiotic biosynthesis monooxygenase [Deltaproteobacteria bacterium]|jgi:heme-degrading monooxygenase HmoA|nr:antibiotic biosynthesis monooxygenase [Deltaproteobacteria bacterium]
MVAVIFEVEPKPERRRDYLDIAASLKAELEAVDGFISVERFESIQHPGKILSLSFWRDEKAVRAWRLHPDHREAQLKGRSDIFHDYRLRVGEVVLLRDYGMYDRGQAPQALPPPPRHK